MYMPQDTRGRKRSSDLDARTKSSAPSHGDSRSAADHNREQSSIRRSRWITERASRSSRFSLLYSSATFGGSRRPGMLDLSLSYRVMTSMDHKRSSAARSSSVSRGRSLANATSARGILFSSPSSSFRSGPVFPHARVTRPPTTKVTRRRPVATPA